MLHVAGTSPSDSPSAVADPEPQGSSEAAAAAVPSPSQLRAGDELQLPDPVTQAAQGGAAPQPAPGTASALGGTDLDVDVTAVVVSTADRALNCTRGSTLLIRGWCSRCPTSSSRARRCHTCSRALWGTAAHCGNCHSGHCNAWCEVPDIVPYGSSLSAPASKGPACYQQHGQCCPHANGSFCSAQFSRRNAGGCTQQLAPSSSGSGTRGR